MDDSPPRPTITRKEVSWHEVCAAVRARRTAEAQGIDPEAKAAVIAAATTGRHTLPPIVLGTLWAMEETETRLETLTGLSHYADQALLALTITDPERVLVSLLAGDLADVQLGMVEIAQTLAPERVMKLSRWFDSEMARLKHLAGGDGEAAQPKK